MRRRRFLLSLGAPLLAGRQRRAVPTESPIVIVGAGLAGLRAATVLQRAGRDVIVLEARSSPGGRVRTVRAPFDGGLHGEAGPMRIPAASRRVLQLVRDHRLTLLPFGSPVGSPVVTVAGRTVRSPEGLKELAGPLRLKSDEVGLTPGALVRRYIGDFPLESIAAAHTPAGTWRAYDEMTWPAWLQSRGASPGAVRLMTLGGDSRQLSALYVLRQIALIRGSDQFYKIDGGMERLPRAMATSLAGVVRYNAPVVRIQHGANAVAVQYVQQNRSVSVRASRVIFAIPFSTLRDIKVNPPFSAQKSRAIAELSYFSASRFLIQTRTRFWESQGLSGSARTDDPAEIWDSGYDLPHESGLIGMTAGGEASDRVSQLTESDAIEAGVEMLARTWPRARAEFQKAAAIRWSLEPWARGAFAAFRPRQLTTLVSDIWRPEGPFHFAGEHTSAWTSWMEGAVESGERVATEILN